MKAGLRERMRDVRAAISPEARSRAAHAVAARVLDLPHFRSTRLVAGYHAIQDELDLSPTFARLIEARKAILLPRIEGDRLALHRWMPDEELERGPFGTRQPLASAPMVAAQEAGLVLVPGLAFDRRGHRLGYGRGYYDRLLASVPAPARVGVAYDAQVIDAIEVHPHDMPMGWVVTPEATLRPAVDGFR